MNFKRFDAVIDVRSPAEYAEDHVPGAISAPVLDDAERAEVGTLYKQVSPFDAKKAGASLISRNIARHVEELFKDKGKTWRPLVYCWRGGKRSGAMAHVMREVGWNAETLTTQQMEILSDPAFAAGLAVGVAIQPPGSSASPEPVAWLGC